MKLRSVLAAFAMLTATPAFAEVKTFAHASGWEAFGGVGDNGTAVCGLSVESDDSWFSLKYFKGSSVLTVQLSDSEWVGKVGDKVTLGMKFDDHTSWRSEATAFKLNKDIALEFSVSSSQVDRWMEEFKESQNLIIVFANSSVSSWHADLTGTKVIGEAMEKCVGWMGSR